MTSLLLHAETNIAKGATLKCSIGKNHYLRADPYQPETHVVTIPEEDEDSQNERRKRSLSRKVPKWIVP